MHGSVQIRLCQTHANTPPRGARKPPCMTTNHLRDRSLGACGESQRECGGPDTKEGTMANVKAGWLLRGGAQLLLSEGKTYRWEERRVALHPTTCSLSDFQRHPEYPGETTQQCTNQQRLAFWLPSHWRGVKEAKGSDATNNIIHKSQQLHVNYQHCLK